MPVGSVEIVVPMSELPDRRSMTARKSLSASSASPADTSRYGDGSPDFAGSSRDGEAQETTTAHTAKHERCTEPQALGPPNATSRVRCPGHADLDAVLSCG